jgi:hypothetical protein
MWRAWWVLHRQRPHVGTMGQPIPGRIPYLDIDRWCDRNGFLGRLEMAVEVTAAMDEAYLAFWADEVKRQNDKPKGKPFRWS